MTPDQEKKQWLESMLKMLAGTVTKAEFTASFKVAMEHILKVEKTLVEKFNEQRDSLKSDFNTLAKKITDGAGSDVSSLITSANKLFAKALKEQADGMNFLRDKVRNLKQAEDGEDGHTPTKEELTALIKPLIPEDVEETANETREKLESLEGDERLDKSAVKGIEEIEANLKKIELRPVNVGGAKGIGLYIGGSKKLLTAQTLNFIAGANVTLNYSHNNGRNDITISAGSGAFALLTATGTVNDANVTFTFVSTPSVVVVNGASYRNGFGCTISGTTVTLNAPVGTGGDIYAIG